VHLDRKVDFFLKTAAWKLLPFEKSNPLKLYFFAIFFFFAICYLSVLCHKNMLSLGIFFVIDNTKKEASKVIIFVVY